MATTSTRYVALLRAINIGGHTVKMDALRKHFTTMGFAKVETLIASGNVLFDASASTSRELEEIIATGLERILGYPVATFVRTGPELAAVVAHEPFPRSVIDPDQHRIYIGFLSGNPGTEVAQRVAALRTPVDELAVHGRELYWGCRKLFSDSQIKPAVLDKALGVPMTVRNITTVRKLAAKLA